MHFAPAGWVNDAHGNGAEGHYKPFLFSDQNNSQDPSVAAPQTVTAQSPLTK